MLESNTEVKTRRWWMKGWEGHEEALGRVAGSLLFMCGH